MGGSTSKFESTDWETSDGGLRDASDTLDGAQATTSHVVVSLQKTRSNDDDREFSIFLLHHKKEDESIYRTIGVQNTVNWFDVVSSQTGGEDDFLLRVVPEPKRLEWDVYSRKPSYAGQKPEKDLQQEDAGIDLYRKVKITIALDKFHAHVYRFRPSDTVPAGVADRDSPILWASEIKGRAYKFQTTLPRTEQRLDPPLIGYWEWEDAAKNHRLRMHLAKGTDLVLHCIVAIVTNMVRLERDGTRHI